MLYADNGPQLQAQQWCHENAVQITYHRKRGNMTYVLLSFLNTRNGDLQSTKGHTLTQAVSNAMLVIERSGFPA